MMTQAFGRETSIEYHISPSYFWLTLARCARYVVSVLAFALWPLFANAVDDEQFVRVASISFEPIKLDVASNANQLEKWFRAAAAGGAKIAVAPEGALEGYIVNEILAQTISVESMQEVAQSIDSPVIQRFRRLARELDLCLVFGFAERIGTDVFNSAVFIANDGEICGKYHKMQFHEGYDEAWWFNRLGRESRAIETPYGRCGIMICNDRWNPLLAQIPAFDGAQFLVIPSFGSTSKSQDEAVLSRGREVSLPVIEANVGVSLIVSDNTITAINRQKEGITFGEIRIPPPKKRQPLARDRVESEFLSWRAKEMPVRLASYQAKLDPRGVASSNDVVVIRNAELEVTVGNNKSTEINGKSHRAGYNGIFSMRSKRQTESPFVPAYAGLNLEHYFDAGERQESHQFFEPRHASMNVRRIDANTVELHQPKTPVFQVESWTRFQALRSNYIDFSFRMKPHRDDYKGDFLGVFWASYINAPLNKSMYFVDASSDVDAPLWRQLCTQQHNRDSTVRNKHDIAKLTFEGENTLFANESPLRYSAPFFYGRFRNMVLVYCFKPNSNLRFTHSPSGGGLTPARDDTNPAWDYQFIVPNPAAGQEYHLEGRLIYKEWKGRDDVLREVKQYLKENSSPFSKNNLVAWCIVPFDAKHRGPIERAKMVQRLGLRHVAYDWRAEHVATFEAEIQAYEQKGIEFFAFWNWHDNMEGLIRKYEISPQIWKTNPSPKHATQKERIEAAVESLLPLVMKTKKLGLRLGLYNHGGWGGEPKNLIAVCDHLRKHHDAYHVGVVYNLHHAHGQMEDFANTLRNLQPYLLCLNVNGMVSGSDLQTDPSKKILPIGSGHHDLHWAQVIRESGYSGPVGILDHRKDLDAEFSLQQNLDGLQAIQQELD